MAMDQYNDYDDEIMIQYMIYVLNINIERILLLSDFHRNKGFIGILRHLYKLIIMPQLPYKHLRQVSTFI